MNMRNEYKNGFIIFLLLGLFFLTMDLAGLANVFYLKIFNFVFVLFGVNLTLKHLSKEKANYLKMFSSGMVTALIGIVLSLIGLFVYMKITDADMTDYSTTIIPSENLSHYFLALFAEGISSAIVVVFTLMQYWKTKNVSQVNAD